MMSGWLLDVQDQKMEGLVVQLDTYARLGIPKLHHLNTFQDPSEDKVEEGRTAILLLVNGNTLLQGKITEMLGPCQDTLLWVRCLAALRDPLGNV